MKSQAAKMAIPKANKKQNKISLKKELFIIQHFQLENKQKKENGTIT